jgi:hypothetical protein
MTPVIASLAPPDGLSSVAQRRRMAIQPDGLLRRSAPRNDGPGNFFGWSPNEDQVIFPFAGLIRQGRLHLTCFLSLVSWLEDLFINDH